MKLLDYQDPRLNHHFIRDVNNFGYLYFSSALASLHAFSKPRILLAEDHPLIQKASHSALQRLNCNVEVVSDGLMALSHYQARASDYDALILDIHMPHLSGLQVCQWIRTELKDSNVPIIAYSTFENISEQECYQAGFTRCLNKPAKINALGKILEHYVPGYRVPVCAETA